MAPAHVRGSRASNRITTAVERRDVCSSGGGGPIIRSQVLPSSSSQLSSRPDPLEVRRQVNRIVTSAGFINSERMRRFLQFTVERALDGRSSELKEYSIGVEVFDRRPDYDPRLDPVVRVEARRLRSKLAAYYEKEADESEVVIELPRGSYVPVFRRGGRRDAGALPPGPSGSGGIAVLRFANFTRDPDKEYFSDGLTQELIHRLTTVPDLKVVAWNTAARITGNEQEVIASARELGIRTVLTGSVRGGGDRLRVTAQLIDTADGTYLCSCNFDRRIEDLVAIEEEIAGAIINALSPSVPGGAARQAPRRGNAEACRLYLQGRHHWGKRTPASILRSAELFREAIAIDPQYAAAHAGLADALILCADYSMTAPLEAIAAAREAAKRALEIDPMLAEATTSLALIRSMHDWLWNEGEQLFQRAIALNPGYVTAHQWYGVDHLAIVGRFSEAVEETSIAAELDPLSPIILEGLGMLAMFQGHHAEAHRYYRQALDLDPHWPKAYGSIGRVHIQEGRYEDAIAAFEKARSMGGRVSTAISAEAQAHALAGNRTRALELLGEIEEMARAQYVPYTCFAIPNIGLGEKERALEWLERAFDRRDPPCTSVAVHPVYAPLRDEPRFAALIGRLGIEQAGTPRR